MIGWHVRNLHYVKDLKPLSEYLEPPTRAAKSMRVLELFKRKLAKQEAE